MNSGFAATRSSASAWWRRSAVHRRRGEQVIALKKKVCDGNDKGFVVIPRGHRPHLPRHARKGVRRLAPRQEAQYGRLVLSCGGVCIAPRSSPLSTRPRGCTSTSSARKYTFVEDVANPGRIITRGPNVTPSRSSRTRSGTAFGREERPRGRGVVPGAGALSALSVHLLDEVRSRWRVAKGRRAFAEASRHPQTLAENSDA